MALICLSPWLIETTQLSHRIPIEKRIGIPITYFPVEHSRLERKNTKEPGCSSSCEKSMAKRLTSPTRGAMSSRLEQWDIGVCSAATHQSRTPRSSNTRTHDVFRARFQSPNPRHDLFGTGIQSCTNHHVHWDGFKTQSSQKLDTPTARTV